MQMTNLEMLNYRNFLLTITKKVNGRAAYGVFRNIRKLTAELPEFENIRNELITKYGCENEEGQFFIIPGTAAYDQFMEEFKEYAAIRHTVDIYRVPEESLIATELDAAEMLQMEFMTEQTLEIEKKE